MTSFRAKVLDALDIHKKTIKLQINERFPKTFSTVLGTDSYGEPTLETGAYTVADHVDYAVSKCVKTSTIGPSFSADATGASAQLQKLDCLGFVVGESRIWSGPNAEGAPSNDHPDYLNSYPYALKPTGNIQADTYDWTDANNQYGTNVTNYLGFHELSGLYDVHSEELKSMRKSALTPLDRDSMGFGTLNGVQKGEMEEGGSTHSHKDWPDNVQDQVHLLNQNPYADALYYHSMRMQLLITGITIPNSSEKASNHRGVVRMLILRPRMPSVRTRWSGTNNEPIINMDYPPHWDTDLFYSGKKTLGGRLDKTVRRDDTSKGGETHLTPTFGLYNRADTDHGQTGAALNVDPDSLHYGHVKPTEGKPHDLTAFDIFSAPINREKYALVADKTFTLDTRHHGVASTRIENVVIPFNKKVKFAGRKPHMTQNDTQSADLSSVTWDDPLNMKSRPIVMLLSLDQKISCQVTGYTTISEC